jgi:hypothetical protein
MKSYKEILEALKGKQHKIDKNKNGQIDAHDFKLLRKEEIELDEATVKTQKYSWGTMKTVHHGADFSIPLHPEHHKEIAKLKDEQEHHFKTEDGKSWTARRKGDEVHFQGANGGNSTKVGFHTMKEEYENLYEEDHSELARKSAEDYRKALARGDSVAANAANAEHIRHKKAAMLMRKKSHTPGEIEEATKKEEVQLSEEHIVHVNDGSKYGDQPHDKDAEHVMAGVKKHGGEFDGHSDKGAYFKFKSHEDAKNFKRHVDSCPHKTCDADLHESVDFNKWVSGGKQTTPKPQKEVVEKEPENTVKGSQIKFLNTFREENQLDEKINLAKTGMGDVIKDFQKSDAPQFAGKTKEKRREMAIAAKLEADRQQNEGVIQPSGSDAMEVGIDKPKDTVVRDKKGNLISFKHEGAWKKSTGTITDKSGAKHSPMSRARDLARSAMKTVKEDIQDLDEAFINGREYASQGVMHPTHAAMHKVGDSRDFYAHGTGDKISGKVVKSDNKEVHIQADKMSGGKLHKFNVTSQLPKQQNEGVNKSDVPAYLRKNDKLTTQDLEKERTKNRSHPETIKKINGTEMKEQAPVDLGESVFSDVEQAKSIADKLKSKHEDGNYSVVADHGKHRVVHAYHSDSRVKKDIQKLSEQAPVAPVPGQKWKDHAVMVNGRQRVVIHRKNAKNYPETDGWKEVAPGQKVKEDIDLDGNYVSEPMSYQEFAMMIEGRAQYMVKATHNKTGNVKVSTYVADKDESEYGVRSRAEREHKPMGYSINSVRRKDVEAHGEDEEDETVSTQKRGRGRPAGSKSGARGPRIK